jgi:sterol O-acyltransferase
MTTPGKRNGKLEVPPVIGRTVSGGFKTEEGTIYVSKPYRSKKSKKLRAMVAFTPRKSAFDTTNEMSGTNEFRVRRAPPKRRII